MFLDIVEFVSGFLKFCIGIKFFVGVWCYIIGIDLVWDGVGKWFVLEDNLWVFFGIFYVLENWWVMKSIFFDMF